MTKINMFVQYVCSLIVFFVRINLPYSLFLIYNRNTLTFEDFLLYISHEMLPNNKIDSENSFVDCKTSSHKDINSPLEFDIKLR